MRRAQWLEQWGRTEANAICCRSPFDIQTGRLYSSPLHSNH